MGAPGIDHAPHDLAGLALLGASASAQFGIKLEKIGSYETGIFDGSAAEIAAMNSADQIWIVWP